ncbi:MAG: M16 family metallopeptidase [Desulfobacteraceae bacterium]
MYQKTVLPPGIKIITEEIPHSPSVSVGLWVQSGSRDETRAENGTSHFLEHMAFKGTQRRGVADLAREIDQLGGSSNAFTTKENTCFHGKVLADQVPELIDLLSDILLNPTYQPEELERERRVILQEILTQEDSPEEYIHELFSRQFWGENPFGRSITGSVETVSQLTRTALINYREETYRPEQLVIAAAGGLGHHDLVRLVGSGFQDFRNGRPPRPRTKVSNHPGVHFCPRDLEQVHVCLGTRAPAAADRDRYAAILLNLILGGNMSSRLFQEVREKRGLCYAIYSFFTSYSDTGLLAVNAAVSPEDLSALLEVIKKELIKLADKEVPRPELQAAQEYLRRALFLSSEDNDNRMIRLAKNEINLGGFIPYEEIISNLQAVTAAQIQQLAQKLFSLPDWTLVFLGPMAERDIPWDF